MRQDRYDRAHIDGKSEWITLACGSETLCPIDGKSCDDGRQLLLDIGIREAAWAAFARFSMRISHASRTRLCSSATRCAIQSSCSWRSEERRVGKECVS